MITQMGDARRDKAIERWLDHLRAAGRSPSTIRIRRTYIRQALDGYDPAAITTGDIEQWLAGKHWSAETRRAAISAVRGFFTWAIDAGLRNDDPSRRIVAPPQPSPAPHPTPEAAIRQALQHPNPTVRQLVRLVSTTGLRRTEAAKVHSRDLSGDLLSVVGKGGKFRQVPVPPDVAAFIAAARGFVFPGNHEGHLAPNYVATLISKATGYSTHSLRHHYATTIWRRTGDLFAVQRLLGHANAATTERYLLMDEQRIRAAASAAWVA